MRTLIALCLTALLAVAPVLAQSSSSSSSSSSASNAASSSSGSWSSSSTGGGTVVCGGVTCPTNAGCTSNQCVCNNGYTADSSSTVTPTYFLHGCNQIAPYVLFQTFSDSNCATSVGSQVLNVGVNNGCTSQQIPNTNYYGSYYVGCPYGINDKAVVHYFNNTGSTATCSAGSELLPAITSNSPDSTVCTSVPVSAAPFTGSFEATCRLQGGGAAATQIAVLLSAILAFFAIKMQ